jgi:hypothetical protein
MPLCTADCADFTLTPMPAADCEPKLRTRNLDKIGFYLCSETIPEPLDCATLKPMIDSGAIVFTSPLRNVTWDAPEFENIVVSDCMPATQYMTGRKLTVEDAVAVEVQDSSGNVTNPFGDYEFWNGIKKASFNVRVILKYCDGTLEIPKDDKGNPVTLSIVIYRNYEKQGSNTNPLYLELKHVEINFKGDPLPFVKPELDLSTCPDINI